MIRVLVADDHDLVRSGLREILKKNPEIDVQDETRTGEETLEKVVANDLDVVLLDLSFPDRNGLDILAQIRKKKPDLPVLILTMHPEDQFGVLALKNGASGYLTKTCNPDLLVEAIKKVAQGEVFVNSKLVKELARVSDNKNQQDPHKNLSKREFQVFSMLISGLTITQIAGKLDLSVKTISTHRARILEKMNLKNNIELSHYAIKHGLI